MGLKEDLLVSPTASSLIGALSGSVEVIIQQPSVAWKNAIQDKRPVPLDPRLMYRGVIINATSMAPINGLQFGVNQYLEEKFAVNGELSEGARTGIATIAGAVSGLVSGPAELLMIQQQKQGSTLSGQAREIFLRHGATAFLRGMNPTLVREAIFTGAYLGVIPILRERMHAMWPQIWEPRPVASMATASVIAGVAASVVTQPFDTVKTRMQANLELASHRTMVGTAASMWREGGMRVLFSGLLARSQRVTCAVFILSEAKDRLSSLYLHILAHTDRNVALALEHEGRPATVPAGAAPYAALSDSDKCRYQ